MVKEQKTRISEIMKNKQEMQTQYKVCWFSESGNFIGDWL